MSHRGNTGFSNKLSLVLTNPTAFPARYRILKETGAAMAKPLPPFAYTTFLPLDLGPGETTTVVFE